MPTQLDKALQSKNLFLGFAGLVTAVSAWVIWGPSDVFPKSEPIGPPDVWTMTELRNYLTAHNMVVESGASKAQLVARVNALRILPSTGR